MFDTMSNVCMIPFETMQKFDNVVKFLRYLEKTWVYTDRVKNWNRVKNTMLKMVV